MVRVSVSIEGKGSLLAREILVGQRTEWKKYGWTSEQVLDDSEGDLGYG